MFLVQVSIRYNFLERVPPPLKPVHTVAEKCDNLSQKSATVAVVSPFSATVWTGLYSADLGCNICEPAQQVLFYSEYTSYIGLPLLGGRVW